MKRILFIIIILLVVLSSPFLVRAEECTVLIAGKNTTIDGSILFAKTEDSTGRTKNWPMNI